MSKLRKRTWKLCSSSSLVDASLGGKINLGHPHKSLPRSSADVGNVTKHPAIQHLMPGDSLGSAEPRVKCNGEGALSAGLRQYRTPVLMSEAEPIRCDVSKPLPGSCPVLLLRRCDTNYMHCQSETNDVPRMRVSLVQARKKLYHEKSAGAPLRSSALFLLPHGSPEGLHGRRSIPSSYMEMSTSYTAAPEAVRLES